MRTRKFRALETCEFCLWVNKLLPEESNQVSAPKVRPEFLGHGTQRMNHRFQYAPGQNKIVRGD